MFCVACIRAFHKQRLRLVLNSWLRGTRAHCTSFALAVLGACRAGQQGGTIEQQCEAASRSVKGIDSSGVDDAIELISLQGSDKMQPNEEVSHKWQSSSVWS